MYVRWVIRKHKNTAVADMSFHDAYLVESYRDEKGQPRQRTICYLGNIRQIGRHFPSVECELFMMRAERILITIEEVAEIDRETVMNMLRQKVPQMTPEEVLAGFRANLQWYHSWWKRHGGPPPREEIERVLSQADQSIDDM
jgi:hypothetical protein